MPSQWPAPDYTDGDINVAQPCSLPELSSPIPATTAEYLLRQDFQQFRKDFAPLALDTAHPSAGLTPDYSAYKLVAEGERKDIGGGLVRWTRTYALVPATHNEFESFGYTFIGFTGVWYSIVSGGANPIAVTGRPRFTRVVSTRVQQDYFLTASPGAITSFSAQLYYQGGLAAGQQTDFLNDTVGGIPASVPTRTQYNSLISNAQSTGWSGGVYAGSGAVTAESQLVAEDSRITRWMGNIWLRQTRFILAA